MACPVLNVLLKTFQFPYILNVMFKIVTSKYKRLMPIVWFSVLILGIFFMLNEQNIIKFNVVSNAPKFKWLRYAFALVNLRKDEHKKGTCGMRRMHHYFIIMSHSMVTQTNFQIQKPKAIFNQRIVYLSNSVRWLSTFAQC